MIFYIALLHNGNSITKILEESGKGVLYLRGLLQLWDFITTSFLFENWAFNLLGDDLVLFFGFYVGILANLYIAFSWFSNINMVLY